MMANSETVVLSKSQSDALMKVFKLADVDETGLVDIATISTLAVQLMGPKFSETEKEGIAKKAEAKADKGMISYPSFVNIMLDTMSTTTQWGHHLMTPIDGTIGFVNIKDQLINTALKRGIEFNIMVVGASGLGKSTLTNTLFKAKAARTTCSDETPAIQKTVQIKSVTHVLEENGITVKLTITDTPGFGDLMNNKACWEPAIHYIQHQYDNYLNEEVSINRRIRIPDTRIHCCLYFITPTGHGLKRLDVLAMKHLDNCVNVIPVIAKADTLTLEERESFKQRIREDIHLNDLNIYPLIHQSLGEEDIAFNNSILEQFPFAVVGSDRYVKVDDKMVLGRQTKWGVIEVENRDHCEFPMLRDLLIKTNMDDLIEVTKIVHYENYRRARLSNKLSKVPGRSDESLSSYFV